MNWTDIQALVPRADQAPDFQACLEAFPALEFAKTTPQGSYHLEGDVWVHTKMVVEALLSLPDYQAASRADQETVFLAALLHDVAKYSTTVIDPVTGNIGQPGHSRKGSIDARIALWDAEAPFEVREAICRLISVHQLPFYTLGGSRPRSHTPEYTVRLLSCQMSLPLLSMLAEADMRGRICADQQKVLDNIELFRELAREEGCYGQPRPFVDAHTRVSYFRGADVHPDYPLFQESGSKVIVMSGPPASGKNTWVEKNHPSLPVVSFDDARAELGLKHGKNEGAVAHRAVDKAKELLRKKAPFVWNATHLSEQMRSKTLDLLFAYNAEVELVYLERPRKELLQRNHKRDTSLSNKALEAMLLKWDLPMPTEAHIVSYLS
jgi:predicted kinase